MGPIESIEWHEFIAIYARDFTEELLKLLSCNKAQKNLFC